MKGQQSPGLPNGLPQPGTVESGHHAPGIAFVCLRGEHDLSTTDIVRPALEAAMDGARVIVDLSACTFIDSSVIACLIGVAHVLEGRSERLVLVIPPDQATVARVAQVTRLDQIIPVFTSRQAALWSLQRPNTQAVPGPRT